MMNGFLSGDFEKDEISIEKAIGFGRSYDLKKRTVGADGARTVIYYLEGFQNGKVMADVLRGLTNIVQHEWQGSLRYEEPDLFSLPALDIGRISSEKEVIANVTSGKAIVLSESKPFEILSIDARTYPSRTTSEPENDRVMRGARDGFVEVLISNITLIRRRIRDPELTVRHVTAGKKTKTDLAVVYMSGKADSDYAEKIIGKLEELETSSLVLGHQSVIETLIREKWYDPFPKIRATERPDAASAALLEGNILILCDNSPEALILPTSVFDFLQVTDDYYFPPLTGSYLRLLRHVIFALTVYLIPVWYLLLEHSEILPPRLAFIVPSDPGDLPILLQLILTEFTIDGLKLASLNTPNMLSGSLSIVGGLLLGDFAVQVGWLCPDVILYMAFVAIANFTQTSFELGYAFKYLRIITLLLTAAFDVYGLAAGAAIHVILLFANNTLASEKGYVFPLVPFCRKALMRLLFRMKKND